MGKTARGFVKMGSGRKQVGAKRKRVSTSVDTRFSSGIYAFFSLVLGFGFFFFKQTLSLRTKAHSFGL